MRHKLSQPFIKALRKVTGSLSSLRDSTPVTPSEAERAYDVRFLGGLPGLMRDGSLGVDCRRIRSREKSETGSYYGKDVRMEFHQLLCRLLDVFEQSLSDLSNHLKDDKKRRVDFDKHVYSVLFSGTALWEISRGSAIRQHLQDILPLLKEAYMNTDNETWPAPTDAAPKENVDADELEGVQPFVMSGGKLRSLSQSFRDWLKLMVVNINAVNILVGHVENTLLKEINIKILVAPPVSSYKTMLHWEEMLKSPFFPASLVKPDGFDPSNDLIIGFLKSWSGAGHGTVDGLLRCLNDVLTKKGTTRFRRALSKAPGYLSSMRDSEVEGWQRFRADIIPDLQDILNGYSPSELDCKAYSSEEPDCNDNLPKAYLLDSEAYLLLQNAVSALQSLKDSALLFRMLARMPKSKPFEGTSHCEANICAFWSTGLEKRWKDTADQLDVSRMNVVFYTNGPHVL